MNREILEGEHVYFRSLFNDTRDRCIIFPANVSMVAESVQNRYHSWSVRTKVASDLMIQIGEKSFHLHKIPMVTRSAYINRLVFQRRCRDTPLNICIDNLPGGSKIFELVVNFCYGRKVELTAANIAPLHCAAHFLEMSDDLEQGNLISKTGTFLTYLIFSSWKDTFKIFKTCESLSSWARQLEIVKRCAEAVACKVCMDPNEKGNNWWFKDLSYLRIDHFIEVIKAIKRKGIKSEILGQCIAHWTMKWLARISFEFHSMNQKQLTIESLIKVIIPEVEKSVSFNFLLHLLKVGMIMKVNGELLNKVEMRLAMMLESCRAKDLLVKNCGYGDSVYDVGIVVKVVEAYVLNEYSSSRIFVVGRLVDEYLIVVARDENVEAKVFQLLVEALPMNSRLCHDNLYRAIDMYLKAHPSLTEEERSGICRSMEHHKLSQDAQKHAMKNDRLPLDITTRFILIGQVNMTRSITAAGSNYHRTKSQAIMRVSKSIKKGCMKSQKEIKMMKQDVETIKVQLCELHLCRKGLQRQVKATFRREELDV